MPVALKTTYTNIWDKVKDDSDPAIANIAGGEWNATVKRVDHIAASTFVELGLNTVRTRTDSIIIGDGANDTVHPSSTDGSGKIAIGQGATARGWRHTTIGSLAEGHSVSGTTIGYAAYTAANCSHTNTIGRGAQGLIANGNFLGALGNNHLYLGNSHGHAFDFVNSIDPGIRENPENETKYIHGQNAKDWRAVPSSFDKKGGDLALCGGTGSGNNQINGGGGRVVMMVGKYNGESSGNASHNLQEVAYFDAERSASFNTNFVLKDLTTGTMKRVTFGTDNGGVSGKKVLVIDA